ncbi:hypothetical protein CFP56_042316 [Quercus suber]|uniref:Uncharacterized protein n=1 Tax=Quercus suber TaxID=58331 RepID=A0AAW0LKD8_QUESU
MSQCVGLEQEMMAGGSWVCRQCHDGHGYDQKKINSRLWLLGLFAGQLQLSGDFEKLPNPIFLAYKSSIQKRRRFSFAPLSVN